MDVVALSLHFLARHCPRQRRPHHRNPHGRSTLSVAINASTSPRDLKSISLAMAVLLLPFACTRRQTGERKAGVARHPASHLHRLSLSPCSMAAAGQVLQATTPPTPRAIPSQSQVPQAPLLTPPPSHSSPTIALRKVCRISHFSMGILILAISQREF